MNNKLKFGFVIVLLLVSAVVFIILSRACNNTESRVVDIQDTPNASVENFIPTGDGLPTVSMGSIPQVDDTTATQVDNSLKWGCQSKGEGLGTEGIPLSEYVLPLNWTTPSGHTCVKLPDGSYAWYTNGVFNSPASWNIGRPWPKPENRPDLWP